MKAPSIYPKPGANGGVLIRQVIATLRKGDLSLPASDGCVWIGVSGGPDSVALLALLARFGRRVVPHSRLRAIHIHHGWNSLRGDAPNVDEAYVRKLCKTLAVPLVVRRLKAPSKNELSGRSLEEFSREQRSRIFKRLLKSRDLHFTGHHADDQAETVLWQILTGQSNSKGEGVRLKHGQTFRPFLNVRKATLQAFLEEEKIQWQTDETNFKGDFLRARLRREVFPALEKIFPKAVEHLAEFARLRTKTQSPPALNSTLQALLKGLKVPTRRAHFEAAQRLSREIHLPGGSKLKVRSKTPTIREWILEESLPNSDREP